MAKTLGELIAAKKGIGVRAREVGRSEEFKRIASLPRRTHYEDLSYMMTEALKKPQGTMKIWPFQAIACAEAINSKGLLANIVVGGGKSLIVQLIPVLVDAERPLLLLPAQLKDKAINRDIPEYKKHWNLHPNLTIVSYSELSSEKGEDLLFKYRPDKIIADEAHYLKNPGSGRTRRFLRYFNRYPDTEFYGVSGTITKRSIKDYWYLVKLALKEKSPMPLYWQELQDWADALDEGIDDERRPNPGALMEFCKIGETARIGYRRRLVETPGIVTTEASLLGVSLIIKERKIKEIPQVVVDAFTKLRTTWCTPGGEEITDALSMARHAIELSCGFYSRWVWPNGEVDQEWLEARRNWRRFVRNAIKSLRKRPLDTEGAVYKACLKGEIDSPEFKEWLAIRDRVEPVTEAVWLSEFMIDEIEKWIKEHKKGVIWVQHSALEPKIKARGIRFYGADEQSHATIEDDKGAYVAMRGAHGTGKNLQHHFNRNLFISVPTSGDIWEQTLGRTHRQGQQADEVIDEIFLHTRELWGAFYQARKDAEYQEETTGQRQRLKYADILIPSEDEVMHKMLYSKDPLWGLADDL